MEALSLGAAVLLTSSFRVLSDLLEVKRKVLLLLCSSSLWTTVLLWCVLAHGQGKGMPLVSFMEAAANSLARVAPKTY